MLIHYQRAGGLGGPATRQDVTVNTEDIPAPAAAELQNLVAAADLPGCPEGPAGPRHPQARDQFSYRVTLDDRGQRHVRAFSDLDMPDKVRPLIDWLHRHACGD